MKALFSLSDIESIKRELGHRLPEVKSSHRVEGMARGLGWNTHAALLADLRKAPAERTADQSAFARYLQNHGFPGARLEAFEEAVVSVTSSPERAIRRVQEQYPALASWGFGILRDRAKSREQVQAEFESAREEMLTVLQ